MSWGAAGFMAMGLLKRGCYTNSFAPTGAGLTAMATTGNGERAGGRQDSGWEAYWRGTGDAEAWTVGGSSHPLLAAFWERFFDAFAGLPPTPRMLDLASGNGAVVAIAMERLADKRPQVSCLDLSAAAVENIRRRFPSVRGIVSDAGRVPLDDGGFEIVTSQFGVEYAGPDAVGEAARLLAPGGRLGLLMHIRDGIIERECRASLDAVTCIGDAGFVPLARDMFRHGFAAVRGADRAPYDEAARRLAPAARRVERLVIEQGEQVAGGTPAQLYADVARIHGRLPAYDPGEVLGWLDRMEMELADYGERMSAMVGAALDEPAFEEICRRLAAAGCELDRRGPLVSLGDDLPLAWAVRAHKHPHEDKR